MGKSRRSFLKSLCALVVGASLPPLRTVATLAPAEQEGPYYYVVIHPDVERMIRAEGFEMGRWQGVHIMESVARHG